MPRRDPVEPQREGAEGFRRMNRAGSRGNVLGFFVAVRSTTDRVSKKEQFAVSATMTQDAAQIARDAGFNPVNYLRSRGYVYDVTDETELRAAFDRGVVSAYVGFDPPASSLHIGHLLGIMMLASLQRFGHRPIALGGGGTALVGDPSGKTSTRALLTEEEIGTNLRNILPQFDRYLDFAGDRFDDNPPALLMNNADWL